MDRRQFLVNAAIAAGFGTVLSACKTTHHHEGHGPPDHAPAHGYRRKHGHSRSYRKHKRPGRSGVEVDVHID